MQMYFYKNLHDIITLKIIEKPIILINNESRVLYKMFNIKYKIKLDFVSQKLLVGNINV